MEFSWILTAFTLTFSYLSSHPLVLCLGLVSLTLGLSPLVSLLINKWIAYAIILIFLGGMMVIFIYMSTLAGNEKLKFLTFNPILLLAPLGVFPCFQASEGSQNLITHLFTDLSVNLLFFLTFYLLMTLFIVIFLTQSFKGALAKHS